MAEILDDGLVRLRYALVDDAEVLAVTICESSTEIGRWLPWCHPGYDREDALAWIRQSAASREAGLAHEFLVLAADGERLLGGCGLNQIDLTMRRANLGYWIATPVAGRGIATAAARLVADFGLRNLGLARIEIVAAAGNRGSQRVAEKIGAVREGMLRNRLRVGETQHDAVGYSLIPQDLGLTPM
jgi:RimJ/RimL family protein N-acetyltransferase